MKVCLLIFVYLSFFLSVLILKSENPEWKIFNKDNSGISFNFIRNIAIDSSNNIWTSAGNSINKFNGNSWIKYNFIDSALYTVYNIEVESNGSIWIGGIQCLVKINEIDTFYYNFQNTNQTDPWIFSIAFYKNNKYFGIQSNSFKIFNNQDWVTYKNVDGLSEHTFALIFDKKEILWLGSNDGWNTESLGMLTKYDGTKFREYYPTTYNYSVGGIYSIRVDKYNNKWIAKKDGGLVKFDDTVFTCYKTDNSGLPNMDVFDIAMDENDVKWIATGGGLAKFDGTNWTVWNTSNSDLPVNRINCIVIDKYGNKWMGTEDGGLAVFREGGVVGIDEQKINIEFSFSCYPNPSKEELTVNINYSGLETIELILYDIYGRKIEDLYKGNCNDSFNQTFELRNITSGVYFLECVSGNLSKINLLNIIK